MDIDKFINSKDIKAYLKQIGYQFSSLETAWLIWKSKYTTLGEKHDAWRELIETMPDCEIEERPNTRPQPSLHCFLEILMEIENRYIMVVQAEEPYIFFDFIYSFGEEEHHGYPTQSYSECFEAAIALCQHKSQTDNISNCRIKIWKVWFDGRDERIGIEVTKNGEVIRILLDDFIFRKELDILKFGFDGMWFDFPNPFKRGDIIYNPGEFCRTDFECDYGPCVLEEEIPLRRFVERWKRNDGGDSSDMLVHGLFQNEDGTMFSECTANYMNFEYYRGELSGKKRILKAISNYLKDEIPLDLLLNAYHTILSEEQVKDTRPWNITKEGLALAGILERDCNE